MVLVIQPLKFLNNWNSQLKLKEACLTFFQVYNLYNFYMSPILSFSINFILFQIWISVVIRFFCTKSLQYYVQKWKSEVEVNSYYFWHFSTRSKRDKYLYFLCKKELLSKLEHKSGEELKLELLASLSPIAFFINADSKNVFILNKLRMF